MTEISVGIEDSRLECKKCGERFKTTWPVQSQNHLCQKCILKLPRCSRCDIITAPEFGFMMESVKYGKVSVCGWCYRDLMAVGVQAKRRKTRSPASRVGRTRKRKQHDRAQKTKGNTPA